MALDLILRNARLASAGPDHPTVDIGVQHGRIVDVEPQLTAEGPAHDAGGKLVSPGLIKSHFHLDKARLIDRVPLQPNRMIRDHMERTAAMKQTFTPEEMYARAQATLPVTEQAAIGQRLGASGVSLAVLPATDLFNAGRHMEHSVMRGVTDANTLSEHGANCTLATNNVLNAFTPYGDDSLTRIANLYANVVQRYGPKDLGVCFEMITERAAQVMRLSAYGIAVGERRGPGGVE